MSPEWVARLMKYESQKKSQALVDLWTFSRDWLERGVTVLKPTPRANPQVSIEGVLESLPAGKETTSPEQPSERD